jgi:hypothetical protein
MFAWKHTHFPVANCLNLLQLLLEAELNLKSYTSNEKSPYVFKQLDIGILSSQLSVKLIKFFEDHRTTSNRYASIKAFLQNLPPILTHGRFPFG